MTFSIDWIHPSDGALWEVFGHAAKHGDAVSGVQVLAGHCDGLKLGRDAFLGGLADYQRRGLVELLTHRALEVA